AILTGEVGNIKSKQAAEQVATHSIGVKRVKNYIKVRPLEAPEDSVIANRIQDALIADPIVDRHEIVVSVLNGVVTLTGTVGNDIEKLRAKTVASGISGVVEVDNDLRVTSFPTVRSDWELRQDIAYHLEWNPMINSDAIDISVDNGQAILEGKVDNWEERRQAREEALQAGAKRVVNNLKVKEKSAASKSSS
ncbi:MAG: BON domain-containing protein, partial [candidate division Zixibacteria bacterium]|nr:BON domain-containing protein [candidate division KSB1 bacterium]NIR65067.1 BON domain-containing protein [candidate division Zixibacteria bacterium]NIW50302.1 BON domain-containing protein [Gammaproteobacteria bacterium]NIS48425.1 BON domain-containing protein [candidate division Zixibacteria bacterium]NIT72127.1 BON domain-containing protein [candidate division KSB1 bacterium]